MIIAQLPDKCSVPAADTPSVGIAFHPSEICRAQRPCKLAFPAEHILDGRLVFRDDRDLESADRAVHIPVFCLLSFHPGQIQLILNLFRRLRIPAVKSRSYVFHSAPPSGKDPVSVFTQRPVIQQAELSQPDHQGCIRNTDPFCDPVQPAPVFF